MNKIVTISLAAFTVFTSCLASYKMLETILKSNAQKPPLTKTKEVPNSKNPLLLLSPDKADFGQKIIIEGKNFCTSKKCSPVTLKLEEQILMTDIIPQNGSFKEIVAIKKPDRIRQNYLLVALQKNEKNTLIEVPAELAIYTD